MEEKHIKNIVREKYGKIAAGARPDAIGACRIPESLHGRAGAAGNRNGTERSCFRNQERRLNDDPE
jgi:hypothetical protein